MEIGVEIGDRPRLLFLNRGLSPIFYLLFLNRGLSPIFYNSPNYQKEGSDYGTSTPFSDEWERYNHYRALFKHHINENELNEIRDATYKSWVLGNDKFRAQIEALTNRQAIPKPKGGDRKSLNYREKLNINRV